MKKCNGVKNKTKLLFYLKEKSKMIMIKKEKARRKK